MYRIKGLGCKQIIRNKLRKDILGINQLFLKGSIKISLGYIKEVQVKVEVKVRIK